MLKRLLLDSVVLLMCFSILIGCEYKPKWEDFQGGIHLVLEVESKGNSSIDEQNTFIIRDILLERTKQFGFKKRIIKINGERRIIIQLPQSEQPQRVIDLFSKSFFLEFKLVDEDHSLEKALNENIPSETEILYQERVDRETGELKMEPFLLKMTPVLTGRHIADARVEINSQNEEPYISVKFDKKGAQLLEQITGENIGKKMAIVLNKKIYSAPVIQDRIPGGNAQITGHFSLDEARDLAIVLRAGAAYPANTTVIESRELIRDIWLGNIRK